MVRREKSLRYPMYHSTNYLEESVTKKYHKEQVMCGTMVLALQYLKVISYENHCRGTYLLPTHFEDVSGI